MSNRLITDRFDAPPNFASVLTSLDKLENLPEIRTFFGRFKNPIGIEVEVEGIRNRLGAFKFWNHTEDGSLRNNGRELISVPLSGRLIDYALHELQAILLACPHRSWSHRCSIHVHQNFSTMREKQLMAYVMIYGLFEELFYSRVAPYRKANAFCYPATSIDPIVFMEIRDDNKYCGLNLAPLKRQCTVEFRHMHGTEDMTALRRWLQLIVKLHAWVERQPSKQVVDMVLAYIREKKFVELAQSIWGVNATLFKPEFIQESAEKNALWALCLSNREFT